VTYIIRGNPITKKNSQRIVALNGHPAIIPSKQYKRYAKSAEWQLSMHRLDNPINTPVNVACVYYMQTRRRVDLVNLLEATMDILVDAGILADDNAKIAVSHDGCRVLYDKANPRVEIEITNIESVVTM